MPVYENDYERRDMDDDGIPDIIEDAPVFSSNDNTPEPINFTPAEVKSEDPKPAFDVKHEMQENAINEDIKRSGFFRSLMRNAWKAIKFVVTAPINTVSIMLTGKAAFSTGPRQNQMTPEEKEKQTESLKKSIILNKIRESKKENSLDNGLSAFDDQLQTCVPDNCATRTYYDKDDRLHMEFVGIGDKKSYCVDIFVEPGTLDIKGDVESFKNLPINTEKIEKLAMQATFATYADKMADVEMASIDEQLSDLFGNSSNIQNKIAKLQESHPEKLNLKCRGFDLQIVGFDKKTNEFEFKFPSVSYSRTRGCGERQSNITFQTFHASRDDIYKSIAKNLNDLKERQSELFEKNRVQDFKDLLQKTTGREFCVNNDCTKITTKDINGKNVNVEMADKKLVKNLLDKFDLLNGQTNKYANCISEDQRKTFESELSKKVTAFSLDKKKDFEEFSIGDTKLQIMKHGKDVIITTDEDKFTPVKIAKIKKTENTFCLSEKSDAAFDAIIERCAKHCIAAEFAANLNEFKQQFNDAVKAINDKENEKTQEKTQEKAQEKVQEEAQEEKEENKEETKEKVQEENKENKEEEKEEVEVEQDEREAENEDVADSVEQDNEEKEVEMDEDEEEKEDEFENVYNTANDFEYEDLTTDDGDER